MSKKRELFLRGSFLCSDGVRINVAVESIKDGLAVIRPWLLKEDGEFKTIENEVGVMKVGLSRIFVVSADKISLDCLAEVNRILSLNGTYSEDVSEQLAGMKF